ADVHDHVAGGRVNGEAHADRSGNGLGNQHDLARPGPLGGIDHRALFHLGDARGHADDDARPHQELVVLDTADELAQQVLGDLEVRDDAVLERAHRVDLVGRAAQHLLRLGADGEHAAVPFVDGDHGGLVQDDAAAFHENQGVGGSKIDRNVGGEEADEV